MSLEIFLWVSTFGLGPFVGFCIHTAIALGRARGQLDRSGTRMKEIEDQIEALSKTADTTLEMHQHYDGDGTPLWYIPRSWAATQMKIVDICQEISQTQAAIASCLERMERRDK